MFLVSTSVFLQPFLHYQSKDPTYMADVVKLNYYFNNETYDFAWSKVFWINSDAYNICGFFFSNFVYAFTFPAVTFPQRKKIKLVSEKKSARVPITYIICRLISWNANVTNSRTLCVSPTYRRWHVKIE